MDKTYTLAGGMTNKIGNNRYFLILDYDDFDESNFNEIKEEITSLIQKFNLSDADIYKTQSGFHVYFFYDNKLSSEEFLKIIGTTTKTDPNFRQMFTKFFDNNKGVPLRCYGKYENRDISLYTIIKGKKPELLEASTGKTIKGSVNHLINTPTVNTNNYKYNVTSIEPGNEIKTPIVKEVEKKEIKEEVKVSSKEIKDQEIRDIFEEKKEPEIKKEENVTTGKEVKKIQASELYVKEKQISEEKQLWYKGPEQNAVARVISSSLDRREGAYVTLRDVKAGLNVLNNYVSYEKTSEGEHNFSYLMGGKIKNLKIANESVVKRVIELRKKQEEEGKDYKYSIDGFIERRPFFMNNHPASKLMLQSYGMTVDKTGVVTTPLNFFKSVCSYDIDNAVLSDKIKNSSIFNFNVDKEGKVSSKTMRTFLGDNKLELLEAFDFIYDFDTHDGNSTESYDECKKMRDLLASKNIPFSLNFSGSKGFHIRIPGSIIAKIVPEAIKFIKDDISNIKQINIGLARFAEENNIKIDLGLYSGDIRGLIRVEWSIHPSTGAVVKPLSDSEFDSLEGKKINEIQAMYKPSVLIKGSKELGVKKLNFQKKDIVVRTDVGNNVYMSWEEIRDSGEYSEDEWMAVRNDTQNPISKELKTLANGTPEEIKEFNKIMVKGEYQGVKVESPEYIDLMTGRNYSYCRKGNDEALREFVINLIK